MRYARILRWALFFTDAAVKTNTQQPSRKETMYTPKLSSARFLSLLPSQLHLSRALSLNSGSPCTPASRANSLEQRTNLKDSHFYFKPAMIFIWGKKVEHEKKVEKGWKGCTSESHLMCSLSLCTPLQTEKEAEPALGGEEERTYRMFWRPLASNALFCLFARLSKGHSGEWGKR